MDGDNICGYWLYGRPYVYIPGDTIETGQRLYLMYPRDKVFPYDRPMPYYQTMMHRKIWFRTYRYVPPGKNQTLDDKRSTLSVIDLWSDENWEQTCSWASRYFRVYVRERDGDLRKLNVRVNGKTVPHPWSDPVAYLKKYKLEGSPDFILKPDWAKDTVQPITN